MIVGVLKEIKAEENRVCMTPAGVEIMKQNGHTVLVEKNAGKGSGFTDKSYENAGAEVVEIESAGDRVNLVAMMKELGRRNIQSVLLEGGALIASEALREGIVDKVALFVAPKMLGGDDGTSLLSGRGVVSLSDAIQVKNIRTQTFGDDILIEGEIA